MANIFQYSIIRYRPYAETGEFANIGVVVFDAGAEEVEHRLAPKRFTRIKGFFDQEAYEAYANSIETLRIELPHLSTWLVSDRGHRSEDVFREIIRTRESSIMYSDVRPVKLSLTLDEAAQRLYDRYVRRDFFPLETPENVFTKGIRKTLRENGIKHFKQVRIEDDVVPISFPLASTEGGFYAIKPLSFAQKNPLEVFDYGAHWRRRFGYLLGKGKLHPSSVLLALEGPGEDSDDRLLEAYSLARDELEGLPFERASAGLDFEASVLQFASQAAPRQSHWRY